MQFLINLLRGEVCLEVEGAFPERFLNICAANQIPFWGLTWKSETCLQVFVTRKSYRKLGPYAERAMCKIKPLQRGGLPFFLGRFRKRYALLAGLGFCLLAVMILSNFVLDVKVTGNETVSTGRILTELRNLGVRVGVYGPSIDSSTLEHQLLLRIPELSWFTLNISGCRANVIVRERLPKPPIIDTSVPSNVVAAKAGIVTRVEVLQGAPQVATGTTVLPGELLISGVDDVEGAAGNGSTTGARYVHAMGNVYARTWYTLSAETPLTAYSKAYTGKNKTHFSLLWGEDSINFYSNGRISFDNYDKIEKTYTITLSDGFTLPIALRKETFAEYTATASAVNRSSAETYLKGVLENQLKETIGDGEILSVSYTVKEENNVLCVTLLGECQEQIGKLVEMPQAAAHMGVNPIEN